MAPQRFFQIFPIELKTCTDKLWAATTVYLLLRISALCACCQLRTQEILVRKKLANLVNRELFAKFSSSIFGNRIWLIVES